MERGLGILSSRSEVSTSEVLGKRYENAYKVARGIVSYGSLVRGLSIVLGVVITIAGLVAADVSASLAVAGVILGACIGAFGYIWGVVISGGGQMMYATIDTAVNTSTLISEAEKANIIGI